MLLSGGNWVHPPKLQGSYREVFAYIYTQHNGCHNKGISMQAGLLWPEKPQTVPLTRIHIIIKCYTGDLTDDLNTKAQQAHTTYDWQKDVQKLEGSMLVQQTLSAVDCGKSCNEIEDHVLISCT